MVEWRYGFKTSIKDDSVIELFSEALHLVYGKLAGEEIEAEGGWGKAESRRVGESKSRREELGLAR